MITFSLSCAPLLPFEIDPSTLLMTSETVRHKKIVDAWPLAPMQEGMLFEWLKDGGGTKVGSTMYVSQESRLVLLSGEGACGRSIDMASIVRQA